MILPPDDDHDFEPLDELDDDFDEEEDGDALGADAEDGDDAEDEDEDEDDDLDEAFPLGDGVADTEATVWCPYCGEAVDIALDAGGGASQQYVEDCHVCCQPWRVSVTYDEAGGASVSLSALDE